jgi:serine/threonine protein kinase
MSEQAISSLPVGTVVRERYAVTAVVGRGGLGTVYQVADVLFGKQNIYALKELVDQSPGARRQFELESQWLQSLDHNNIPKVREHFEWHQRLYLVMDFVDGENLEQKLARMDGRPFSEEQALRWILPVCDALQYLHTRFPPILHRDVKPANIIVTPGGHVVLVDLGIAKAHLPGANQTGTFARKAGTEGYAPPEQYTANGQTGPWSDVYGLGATLYQLLTGRVPPTAVERVALDVPLTPPHLANPAISSWVSSALLHALALRPGDRYVSVQTFAQALAGPALRIATMLPNLWPSSPTASPPTPVRSPVSTPTPPHQSWSDLTGTLPRQTPPLTPPIPLSKPSLRPVSQKLPAHNRQMLEQLRDEVNAEVQEAAAPSANKPEARPRWRSPWVWGSAASAVLLIVAIIGAVLFNASAPPDRSSPRATVSGYFDALKEQNYTLAWQYSADTYTDAASQSSFISGLAADNVQLGRVESVDLKKMTIVGEGAGTATVQVGVTRSKSSAEVNYTLILGLYNGSIWLINSITAS